MTSMADTWTSTASNPMESLPKVVVTWKLGIPKEEYVKSLYRHVNDIGLHFEGCGTEAEGDLENAICGALFNIQGLLFEVVKARTKCKPLKS